MNVQPSPSSSLCPKATVAIAVVRRPHRRSHPTALKALDHKLPSLGERYQKNAVKYWDNFYKRHQNKFFKDRHYLEKDWGGYFEEDEVSPNGKLVLEVGCGSGSTIFPLVASYPKLYVHACDFSPNAVELVKPHGFVLFRDYAAGDFAQVKLQKKDQMIGEGFYVRGDGTCLVNHFSKCWL